MTLLCNDNKGTEQNRIDFNKLVPHISTKQSYFLLRFRIQAGSSKDWGWQVSKMLSDLFTLKHLDSWTDGENRKRIAGISLGGWHVSLVINKKFRDSSTEPYWPVSCWFPTWVNFPVVNQTCDASGGSGGDAE